MTVVATKRWYALPRAFIAIVVLLCAAFGVSAAEPFQDKVVPFLKEYCVRCHDAKTKSGELDLTKFSTSAKILEDFRQWEHVVTFLKKAEMPPQKAKQPPDELRREMVTVLEQVLRTEARKLAGDPGVVPPRRLTNAEFDYSIYDLTGVDIRPAKEFPVDPSAGEGFRNTGEALTMSPALFKKYLAAAELVADHALLTTEGLRFAPHPVVAFADRQKYCEQQILQFYQKHAVDLEKYFSVLWLYKHRPKARKATTVEEWARVEGLSEKYARSLWDTLEGKTEDRFVLHTLRSWWTALPTPKGSAEPTIRDVRDEVRALVAGVNALSRELCPQETPAIVANAGNGPIDHLARRRRTAETRDTFDKGVLSEQKATVTYKSLAEGAKIKLVIHLTDVGAENATGFVIFKGAFSTNAATTDNKKKWSLRSLIAEHDPDMFERLKFGTHAFDQKGEKVDSDAFVLKAPCTLEIDIPTKAFPLKEKGGVLFTGEYKIDRNSAALVSVQMADNRLPEKDRPGTHPVRPLIDPKNPLASAYETSATAFCRLFPNRFYYVDDTRGLSAGFHLIEGFFRDDRPLCRSVLSDADHRELERLWSELYFVTGIWEKMLRGFVFFERSERNFLKHRDFDEFKEEDPELVKDETLARFEEVFLKRSGVALPPEELEKHPIHIFFEDVRAGLRRQTNTLKRLEPVYLRDILAFAERAFARPLTSAEREKMEKLFTETCRDKEHGIEVAVRSSLTRILISPHYCMRIDIAPRGETVAPLSDLALASRLSSLIWSSKPDEELLTAAKNGKLRTERQLKEQVQRMLKDPKVTRFALEFFGQWLGYRDFMTQESVNRQVFPAFDDGLKQAMFEEPTRRITYLIQQDRSIVELLNGDTTLVNKKLAQHYGLSFRDGADWEPISGLRDRGRAGILGMAVFLTKNSQPQRTSPVKRGFWVVHKVLGEHIPPPPPNVAVLPAKETETNGKTIRELLKAHVEEAACARCHQRFDPIGLSMESFDPIGRFRTKDLAGRNVDNVVELPTGKKAQGVPEFADYLAKHRKQEFVETLCKKFLGYALGRSLQLSDEPLLEQMQSELEKSGGKPTTLFEVVVASPQFRYQRCKEFNITRFKNENPSRGEK